MKRTLDDNISELWGYVDPSTSKGLQRDIDDYVAKRFNGDVTPEQRDKIEQLKYLIPKRYEPLFFETKKRPTATGEFVYDAGRQGVEMNDRRRERLGKKPFFTTPIGMLFSTPKYAYELVNDTRDTKDPIVAGADMVGDMMVDLGPFNTGKWLRSKTVNRFLKYKFRREAEKEVNRIMGITAAERIKNSAAGRGYEWLKDRNKNVIDPGLAFAT